MVIVWGSRLYGKVDTVPGLGHVATKFGHLWYLPLFPTESWIVLSESGEGWQGKPVRMSFKSILVAWLRTAMVVGIIGFGIAGAIAYGDMNRGGQMGPVLAFGGLSVGCLAAVIGSYYLPGLGKASHARAVELAQELGLNEAGLIMVDLHYGVIDPAEAEYKLKRLSEQNEQSPQDEWDEAH